MIKVSDGFIRKSASQTRNSYVKAILGDVFLDRDIKDGINGTITYSPRFISKTIDSNYNMKLTMYSPDENGNLHDSSGQLPTVYFSFKNACKVPSVEIQLDGNYSMNIQVAYRPENSNNKYKSFSSVGKKLTVPISTEEKIEWVNIVFTECDPTVSIPKVNNIKIGSTITFEDNKIQDYEIDEYLSLDSAELSSRSLKLQIIDVEDKYNLKNKDNKLNQFAKGTPITMFYYLRLDDGSYEEVLLGTFIVDGTKRDFARKTLSVECYDDLYYLTGEYLGTDFYFSAHTENSIESFLQEIIKSTGYDNFIIYLSEDLKKQDDVLTLTGYVNNGTVREVLLGICERLGLLLKTNRRNQIIATNMRNLIVDNKNNDFYNDKIKSLNSNVVFSSIPSTNENYIGGISIELPLSASPTFATAEIIYQANHDEGTYEIEYGFSPIYENTLEKNTSTSTATYTIDKSSATKAVITVTGKGIVALNGKIVKFYNSTYKNYNNVQDGKKEELEMTLRWNYGNIDSPHGVKQGQEYLKDFKLNTIKPIAYEIETLSQPYFEVGDYVNYIADSNNVQRFTISRINLTKSLIETIRIE